MNNPVDIRLVEAAFDLEINRGELLKRYESLMASQERKDFEQWYVCHVFNLEASPLGSRDCGLQWAAWLAGLTRGQKLLLDPIEHICNRVELENSKFTEWPAYRSARLAISKAVS